ncbi:MAG: adenylate/guanylate cyclase domain-containing protein [Planctomycetota bacterium]
MTQDGFKRKLAAILSADVEGYSRLMDQNEEATVRTLTTYRNAINDLAQQYRGRVVDTPGDNVLAEFNSVVDAVNCAVEIQRDLAERNAKIADSRKMKFRIGINLGDVIEEESRIYGDGVNIAARVESMAEAGGICISGMAYDQVANKLGLEYENLGEHQVKNISRPIRIFRVIMEPDLSESVGSDVNAAPPLPDKPSIAVLPFDNMSGDSEQEYFSDGITEDIITALSRSPWLFVISRNSSFAYRGKMIDVRQVSRELGVRYILEGSVRKAGNRIRVTAQLIDGSVGSHVWAERYDGELQDIFGLQDQISQQVVASILTQIQMYVDDKTKRLDRPDVVTWDLLARGWKLFYELTNESLAEAERIFRRAVSSAPTSCDAHHLLASTLIHRVQMGYIADKKTAVSEAYQLAKRAISLDERNEYAHWGLGFIQLWRRNHDLAEAELKRAIELNPNCSLAFGSLGTVLSYSGEPDESIKNNEIAIRLNPRDISIFFRYSGLAMAHFVAGRYSEAVQWARKCIHRKPIWLVGHAVLVSSLAQLDLLEEAKAAVDNYLENIPDETISELRQLPFKNQDDAHRFEEGLRKAGLPE